MKGIPKEGEDLGKKSWGVLSVEWGLKYIPRGEVWTYRENQEGTLTHFLTE